MKIFDNLCMCALIHKINNRIYNQLPMPLIKSSGRVDSYIEVKMTVKAIVFSNDYP